MRLDKRATVTEAARRLVFVTPRSMTEIRRNLGLM
jgi:hypothetical protein